MADHVQGVLHIVAEGLIAYGIENISDLLQLLFDIVNLNKTFNYFFQIIIQNYSSMTSKYNDQFDFDDIEVKPNRHKQNNISKAKKQEDDFFDLDDYAAPTKNQKLPVLNQKIKEPEPSSNTKQKNKKVQKNAYDDYEQIYEQVEQMKTPKVEIGNKKAQKAKYQQQFQQISTKKHETSKKNLPANNIPLKEDSEEQFYQQLNQVQPPKKIEPKKETIKAKKQQPEEEVYEQQVFDDYGEDFQELQQEKPAVVNKNKNVLQSNKKNQDKKLAINTNKAFTNKEVKPKESIKNNNLSIPKPVQKQNNIKVPALPSKKYLEPHSVSTQNNIQKKTLNKSSSKKSLHSNDSKKYLINSRATTKKYTNTQFMANKHILLVQRKFPQTDDQVTLYNQDKINKMNDQIREMIRKFNEQLNELINKNMILLKDKPAQRIPQQDEKVRVLQQQLKSGNTAMQVAENQLQKLIGREGELRQQQYQLLTQRKIEQCKQTIKQMAKVIAKLKVTVNSEGNKLSKQQTQKKMAQELHQIKIMLMQLKKEEEKNEGKLQKLTSMSEELQGKNADKEYEMSEQIDTAKQKGISLNVREDMKKRYEQLKAKCISNENHKKVIQSLNNTKCEHLIHEMEQLKMTFRSIQNQTIKLTVNIQIAQSQTIKEIRKAKENPRISSVLSDNLDRVLKSIEQNQAINFSEVRTEGNKSQSSQRPAKTVIQENKSKQKPLRNNSSKKDPASNKKPVETPLNDEINLMKPNFMKKKQKNQQSPQLQQKKNPLYQRIWNAQEQDKKHILQEKKRQDQQRQHLKKAQQIAEEQKKSQPFNLKKIKKNNNEQKSFQKIPQNDKKQMSTELKIQSALVQQKQNKEEQKVSIGPKFMKLNKKNDGRIELNVERPAVVEEPKLELKIQKIQKKQNEQEVPFLPKRLNLRNKLEKKQEGYMPTNVQNLKPKEQKKEYAPNFSFKDQELPKAQVFQPKKVEEQVKLQISEEKPKFNLRLRDKQKKQAAQNAYIPTQLTEVPQDKFIKPKINNEAYNPFNKEPLLNEEKPKFNIPAKQEDSYVPSYKRITVEKEKPLITPSLKDNSKVVNEEPNVSNKKDPIVVNNPYAPKQPANNPYAPAKEQVISNPYAPKQPINNPYAPVKEQTISNPYAPKPQNNQYAPTVNQEQKVSNPYAPTEEVQKRQKEGPVKKIKIQNKAPKQKFNIYEQAEDLTENNKMIIDEPIIKKQQASTVNLLKTDELDLNAMLGIKKKEKASDLDDLLGEVKITKNTKKKNTDFFNDLEL